MALETDIKAVRDYVVTTVLATWSDITITHEEPQQVMTPPFGRVVLTTNEAGAETVASDALDLTFEIRGRWAQLTNDQIIDKAAQLRTALLATVNPGNVAYLTQAPIMPLDQDDELDGYSEVGVTFTCRINVPR